MLVAAWIKRLPSSIATNGPQENAPSTEASAVPNTTGTAAAVRLNGRESLNHSAAADRRESATRRPARVPREPPADIPEIVPAHDRPSLTAPSPQFRRERSRVARAEARPMPA